MAIPRILTVEVFVTVYTWPCIRLKEHQYAAGAFTRYAANWQNRTERHLTIA